jgi:hypothetical protein
VHDHVTEVELAVADAPIWDRVDELLARAPRISDLRAHRLQLLELDRRRRLRLPVHAELLFEERRAAANAMSAPALLARARGAYDGRIVVLKGPEVARLYPRPLLRPFDDVDLLVDDSRAAQSALVAAGFEEVGDPDVYAGIHHLRPLHWPGIPLTIEIHHEPKWLPDLGRAPVDEMLAAARPSTLGDGIFALPPEEHALVLALHSWAHAPLTRLSHLIDVALVAHQTDRERIDRLAARWNVSSVWHSTATATDALFAGGRVPLSLRTWARNAAAVRERTVFEAHLERWLSAFWCVSTTDALRATRRRLHAELRRSPDETWRTKRLRTRAAIRNASKRLSDHQRALEDITTSPATKEIEP